MSHEKLTYIRVGDYYIPNLKLAEQPDRSIGKYGRMRRRYLKEYRPALYNSLLLSEKLYPHLLEIDGLQMRAWTFSAAAYESCRCDRRTKGRRSNEMGGAGK